MKTLPTLGKFCELVATHVDSVEATQLWLLLAAKVQKTLVEKQEQHNMPYLTTSRVVVDHKYNKHYGDDRECVCGDLYHRHFDPYEEMESVGCKYCDCVEFVEKETK